MQYTDLIGRITTYAWICFIIVWLVASLFAKKTAKRYDSIWIGRVVTMIALYAVLRYAGLFGPLIHLYIQLSAVRIAGVTIVITGILLAFWARYHLGRNWGQPMTQKQDAVLVTSGPYAYIRHPIYAGVLLAMIGAALVYGALWALLFLTYGGYFLYSVSTEDKIMDQLFPDQYPAYKARTKKVIPGVW